MSSGGAIDLEEVRRIARLAHLSLSEEETTALVRELGAILDSVRKLEELDLEDLSATSHAFDLPTRFRDDTVRRSLDVDRGLRNAPERIGDGFGVPKIIE